MVREKGCGHPKFAKIAENAHCPSQPAGDRNGHKSISWAPKRAALLTIGCGISRSSILSLANLPEMHIAPGKRDLLPFWVQGYRTLAIKHKAFTTINQVSPDSQFLPTSRSAFKADLVWQAAELHSGAWVGSPTSRICLLVSPAIPLHCTMTSIFALKWSSFVSSSWVPV